MKGMIALIVLLAIGSIVLTSTLGIGGCGPTNSVSVTVNRCWVDVEKNSDGESVSHYLVGTDKGTFEIDNGVLLNVYNADHLYGQVSEGKKYIFTTKGNRYENFWLTEFPYITKIHPIPN